MIYPNGTPLDRDVMPSYQVIGMPSTHFITPSGEFFESWTRLLTKETMNELVEKLLEASSQR